MEHKIVVFLLCAVLVIGLPQGGAGFGQGGGVSPLGHPCPPVGSRR